MALKRWRIICWRTRSRLHYGFHVSCRSSSRLDFCCPFSGELRGLFSYLSISSGETIKNSYALLTCFFYLFSSSQSAFYKVLISNAATSALRLHQRLPQIQFTKEFLALLLIEDSCHYLFFSLIFLYVQPFILIIVPVLLFAVLHSASYSLKLLDVSRDNYAKFTCDTLDFNDFGTVSSRSRVYSCVLGKINFFYATMSN